MIRYTLLVLAICSTPVYAQPSRSDRSNWDVERSRNIARQEVIRHAYEEQLARDMERQRVAREEHPIRNEEEFKRFEDEKIARALEIQNARRAKEREEHDILSGPHPMKDILLGN